MTASGTECGGSAACAVAPTATARGAWRGPGRRVIGWGWICAARARGDGAIARKGERSLTAAIVSIQNCITVSLGYDLALMRCEFYRVVATGFGTICVGLLHCNAYMSCLGAEPTTAREVSVTKLRLHDGVSDVTFLSNSDTILTGSDDGVARIWRVNSASVTGKLEIGDQKTPDAVFGSPSMDGKNLFVKCFDKLEKWDSTFKNRAWRIQFPQPAPFCTVVVSPKGSILAAADLNAGIIVFDAEKGEIVDTLRRSNAIVRSCRFSPSGSKLLGSYSDGSLVVWDVKSRKPEISITLRKGEIYCSEFCSDERTIVAACENGQVIVYDTRAREIKHELTGHRKTPSIVRIRESVVLTADIGGEVIQRDIERGAITRRFGFDKTEISSMAISPDGKKFVIGHRSGQVFVVGLEKK